MKILDGTETLQTDPQFSAAVREKSGQPIELCYQCQKCATGCPVGDYTDYSPNQILRMVSFGIKDRVLTSSAIWLCSACETCGVRCPNGIRISEVMDTLRAMSAAAGLSREKQAETFHRMFLKGVQARGRVHEATLMAGYKLKTGQMFTDLDLGLQLFKKGKLPLFPHGIKNKNEIKKIFTRSEVAGEGGKQ
jgi:heterodisulfide reductase subunit C